MDFLLLGLGYVLMAVGLICCFIYKVPGHLLCYAGILVLQFGTDVEPFTTSAIVICAVAIVICMIVERIIPKLIKKVQSFGKGGKIGCMLGSFAGVAMIAAVSGGDSAALFIIMAVLGLLVVPFIFAVLGELIAKKEFALALKSGLSAWVNYLSSTLLQLSVCVYCIYSVINAM